MRKCFMHTYTPCHYTHASSLAHASLNTMLKAIGVKLYYNMYILPNTLIPHTILGYWVMHACISCAISN